MTFQTSSKVLAATRQETTAGSIATVTGAAQVRVIDSPGLQLNRANVQSAEKRTDGLMSMMRLGYKSVQGTFSSEMSVGGGNDYWTAGLYRTSWATATSFSFASVTTVAIATNQLTCGASSSWITAGVRVGDVFYLTGTTVAGDNNVNAQVVAITTGTLVVQSGAFTTLSATATGTLNILKKLANPSIPVPQTFSVEQYDQDIDLSEVFLGCMIVGARFSFRPGQMATVQYTLLGTDRAAQMTANSPYFSSPTLTTSLSLLADDSVIYQGGNPVASFNGFDLNFQLTAKGEPVIGSLVTPQIFDNDLMLDGTITGLRSDFTALTQYDAETEFEIAMLMQEPAGFTTPRNAWSFFISRVKIKDLNANFGGGNGAKIQQLQIQMGPKATTTGYNTGYATICSSGAYPF